MKNSYKNILVFLFAYFIYVLSVCFIICDFNFSTISVDIRAVIVFGLVVAGLMSVIYVYNKEN